MMRIWPDRLAGRIILPIVLVIIGAQVSFTLFFYFLFGTDFWDADQARYAVQQQTRIVSLIEALRDDTSGNADDVMKFVNGQDFHAWLVNETTTIASQHSFPTTSVGDAMRQALDAANINDYAVSSFIPTELELPRHALSIPDTVIFGFGIREPNMLVEAMIGPQLWLRVLSPSAEFETEIPLWIDWLDLTYLGFITLGVIVVVILVVRQATQPIHTLAIFATRIGQGGWRHEEIPEKGPLETRTAARALNVMARRIREFVDDRTHMLAAISHDIASPLTGLRLQAEMVEDAEIRDAMIKGIEEISNMSQSTLSFAKLDASQESSQSVCFANFVRDLIGEYSSHITAFHPTTSTSEKQLSIRPILMRRALRNILDNAIKYGGTASISLDHRKGEFVLDIRDAGPGLPDELLEKVFDPFFRADLSRNPDTGGNGLGLSICRNLIRLHGGDIHLENHVEGGLVARITLPDK